ncbi:hypothetical protein DM860_004980 [Cuscuta australis]|uniref:Chromo domain-containing protein n=1 Tax=Cuscuta australis TaxID=267555 RepID=A0A328DR49_9ASTE|nr:hypothetical protein DM860_004980 [Cuscuta australis]
MPSSKDDSATNTDSSSDDIPESNYIVYSVGEKVLAYHGPRCYDAKVQRAELRNKEWRYCVHYTGWSKNWDEWVGADRLIKPTQENAKKQDKKHSVQKSARSGSSAQAKPKKSTDLRVDKEDMKCNGEKRKADSGTEDSTPVEKLITIQIPSTLNKQLVHDWEFITQQNKLVQLPRSPNVDDILRKYLEYRTEKDGMMTDADGEILNGVRCYFDKSLPVMLLYQKERQQYREAVSGNVSPSSVYGAEHLLRLFVKLPELLACLKVEEETLIQLQQKLLDFLKFLQKNKGAFFLTSYDTIKASGGDGGKGKDK